MRIEKNYEKAFLLESTKLTKLVGIIHERIAENQVDPKQDRFEAFLSDGRQQELHNLEDVLDLENSRQSKIERLIITSTVTLPNEAPAVREIQVDFGRQKKQVNAKPATVTVSIRSVAPGWASRALADVEDQVERTWIQVSQSVTTLTIVSLLASLVLIYVLLSLSGIALREPARPDTMWLNDADVTRARQMLKQNQTLTDAQLRDILTRQLRNVAGGTPMPLPKPDTRQVALVALPVLVVLGCSLYLLATSYPRQVFLWGDELARYENMCHRRKTVWQVIIGIAVVGLLSKSLYEGVTAWDTMPAPSLPAGSGNANTRQ